MISRARRLPGVRFVAPPPPPEELLPPMDVAVFVGFAAAGPLDQPVAVEDVARFAEIFGGDLPLAWDAGRSAPALAFLPAAVRAFFRNGGRRCYVVRVAGPAAPARFAIPGLQGSAGGALAPAEALARSPGGWADGLRVGAALRSRAVALRALDLGAGRLHTALGGADSLAPGDLLRLSYPRAELQLYLTVEAPPAARPGGTRAGLRVAVAGWFAAPRGGPLAALATAPAPPAEAPLAERLSFDLYVREGQGAPRRLADLGFAPAHPRFWAELPDDNALFAAAGLPLGRGELWADARSPRFPLAGPAAPAPLYLPLTMGPAPALFAGPAASGGDPLAREGLAELDAGLFLDPDLAEVAAEGLLGQADFVRYQARSPRPLLRGIHAALGIEEATLVAVPDAVQPGWRLAELPPAPEPGPSHPLPRPAWWPGEACDRGPLPEPPPPPEWQPFAAADPALARPELRRADRGAPAGLFVLAWGGAPDGAGFVLEEARRPDYADARLVARGPERERAMYGRGRGDYYYRVRAEVAGASSDWSEGLLVRVPPGTVPLAPAPPWERFLPCATRVLAPPTLSLRAGPDPLGGLSLGWEPLPGAGARSVLEEATSPDWAGATTIYAGPQSAHTLYDRPAGAYYYRVRAELGELSSDWSNGLLVQVRPGGRWELIAPSERLAAGPAPDGAGGYALRWGAGAAPGQAWALEEARGDDWALAAEIYSGMATTYSVGARPPGLYSYRARAGGGRWSNVVRIDVAPGGGWALPAAGAGAGGVALTVQRALLRLSAARGDLFAALALPPGAGVAEARAHAAALANPDEPPLAARYPGGAAGADRLALVPPLGYGEGAALSYGALYHPWLVGRDDEGGPLSVAPPDGAACAVLAARAARRGAWVAPANEPLRGVVGLEPSLPAEGWPDLHDAQVNLVRREPRGFMALSADTLSRDAELRPINVRRLLALLRRLALRLGASYTFEPNSDLFRDLVRRDCEAALERMFARGAFAGAAPATSFQVRIASGPRDHDQGRLIVELRVAPSLPLSFLTVRLIQSGERLLVSEEG